MEVQGGHLAEYAGELERDGRRDRKGAGLRGWGAGGGGDLKEHGGGGGGDLKEHKGGQLEWR